MRRLRRAALHALLLLLPAVARLPAQERPEVQGTAAAVVADHPLAAAAGADVLRRGGNAMDAAITMAAVLAVVRPHMNGLGGDAFLLFREGRSGRIRALNGSGRSPQRATLAAYRALGYTTMPQAGVHSVTVPGALRAWSDALRRHGSISLAEALAPAIRYADTGFPVSEKLAADIAAARTKVAADPALAAVFLPGGDVPPAGTLLRQQDLARTLQLVARDGVDAFYIGEVARRIEEFMAQENGFLGLSDLADYSPLWQEPIETTYAGHRVLTLPPNSQGVALLMQLNMAELYDLPALGHNTARYIHTLVEVKKRAFGQRDRYVSDPAFVDVPLERLLSKSFARELLADERPTTSDSGGAGQHGDGDTVFLGVVDEQGNAVALIQSLYQSFGSGRIVPGTGIVLHNRGALFSLDPQHVNVLAPRKRTYHTLAPALALRPDRSLAMIFGTPGSDGQTQTLLQVFNNIVLFGMTPQRAVEAPRWRSWDGGALQLETGIAPEVRTQLSGMGHSVRAQPGRSAELGGAQVIYLAPGGVRSIGADPRREAYGIAW